jgi:hypothetical protein
LPERPGNYRQGTPFLYNGEEIGMIDREKLVLTIDKLTLAPLVVVIGELTSGV